MTETVRVAVPRKGRPLEAVLERFATTESIAQVADEITSTLRFEKSVTKGHTHPEHDVYERLADYSDLADPTAPEYTLLRDDRDGMPRRIVFDSVVFELDGVNIHLVGREEPFRALRTHEFGLGFDSADLVLEEVVKLRPDGLGSIEDVNSRIDPMDTDVRVVSGLGDTVYHTLMADPEILPPGSDLDRDFVADYAGDLCISPRYERLVEAVLGTRCLDDVTFAYPNGAPEEEAAIAETGLGVYLTMTGSTAREHGLVLGENLFPSETVLMENVAEATPAAETVKRVISSPELETELAV
ncbi:hypothetical protein E6P09_11580 [Haloferax mediterranei ATCC 33500]|uniref:ATP phosphoribosyltransferase n=1 Tax=Haloferax mediterranei (strain ATCC 33500 / DSM 1411 / JCM 8866 / NBRC 14739 / NCIMB 2177 / R-4) TaxID=523841 RepID=I3R5A8_HALMT|nr:hypothetical protein [Haloferax mediterranei]AFK19418.1 hypothetical protein HFX_1712 [Haloferax mediterranei ATCC 33500]AHZ21232.1 hypothetical protein BM92_00550 [Haloferax mediterranei ATCC 33500]EMA04393.1 hypothetical protein C439_01922 [Haloferax mediterranei ATCC 33500]MDX5989521.1 hypothetical protein [Haloferax mediterranei ATCC 33500]QCQ75879.1 hypothetical protein E6P09_11580 [Haloferax mediterranei ATCC 33500]